MKIEVFTIDIAFKLWVQIAHLTDFALKKIAQNTKITHRFLEIIPSGCHGAVIVLQLCLDKGSSIYQLTPGGGSEPKCHHGVSKGGGVWLKYQLTI